MKKIKKFSAFKLFYDEFIYKEDKSLLNVNRDIEKIKKEVLKIRNTSPLDLDNYMTILNRCNLRIRTCLDEIYSLNPSIFDYYLLQYKARIDSKEEAKDMPFIISCSFYDDYRLDDKSYEELNSSDYVIPRYSSIEKKELRTEAKNGSRLLFFIGIIKNDKTAYRYKKLLDVMEELYRDLRPNGESHYDYFCRVDNCLSKYRHVLKREMSKINNTYLEIILKEKLEIVYRKNYVFDLKFIEDCIKEHFDIYYQEYIVNGSLIHNYMTGNSMSYESYKEYVSELTKEKNKNLKLYLDGKYEEVIQYDNNDMNRFKTALMNSYFDYRYLNSYFELKTEKDFANRTLDFYELAELLDTQLFEKVLFDSSHSKALGRNNDVNSAILEKMYYLYDPFDLLERYDTNKKEFLLMLNKHDEEFMKNYNLLLAELKREKDFHGPLANVADIKLKLDERRKDFLYEKCITDLINYNKSEEYDTRNYDLYYFAQGLSVDDIISVYGKMKYKINNFDFGTITFIDSSINENEYQKEILLRELQKFIANVLFDMFDYGDLTPVQKENRLIDICFTYLKENCLFNDNKGQMNRKDKKEIFDETYAKFYKNSSWGKLLDIYKIK